MKNPVVSGLSSSADCTENETAKQVPAAEIVV